MILELGATCYVAAFVRGATGHRSWGWGALGVLLAGLGASFDAGAEARMSMPRFLVDQCLIAVGAVVAGRWLARRGSARREQRSDRDRP